MTRAAADDIEAGGVVAAAFAGFATPIGSGLALRLFAALHFLVLVGRAPELARYFKPTGGASPPAETWDVARMVIAAELDEIQSLLRLPVQTNEPGRAAPLFGALLYLSERHRLPVRLLEIGASAGLNLQVDRFHYRVDGQSLGDTLSPLTFDEPWQGKPVRELLAANQRLVVISRFGCDNEPIDPSSEIGRLRLLSYVWPDEPARLARLESAIKVARRSPAAVARASASDWLASELEGRRAGEIVVVWQSVIRPYLSAAQGAEIEGVITAAGANASPEQPFAVVELEGGVDVMQGLDLVLRSWPKGERQTLARCQVHGPPVIWSQG